MKREPPSAAVKAANNRRHALHTVSHGTWRTSISVEPEFWTMLKALAILDRRKGAGELAYIIKQTLKPGQSLTSAIRVYCLERLAIRAGMATPF